MATTTIQRLSAVIAAATLLSGCASRAQEPPSGSYLYGTNCAACHGAFGEGDGPVAAALQVGVPNLRSLQQRNDGIFPRDAVIAYIDGRTVPAAHGSRTMPVWGDAFGLGDETTLSERVVRARIEAIVDFLTELQYRD